MKTGGTAARAFALLLVVSASSAPAAPPPPPAPDAAVRRGSEIAFHGWSRNSKYVAYTRQRFATRTSAAEQQRMHRQVIDGEFTGFGTMVGGDVEAFAKRWRYDVTPLPWRRLSETTIELMSGPHRLLLELDVGREHGWRLWGEGQLLARHLFDRIYVGFRADVFPSPDGRQAIVVMHLDSGWDVDAAAFPVDLSPMLEGARATGSPLVETGNE